ncbi:alpha/beta fold hydrolase [Dictyobacter kobayashii]|uniref:alpha/beta fold hydrolase n=1 Tax=Dictyobacter kobayashii TaxID=2014872 RepID=UPI001386E4F9|nr:alpha/beta hydrolase [Dictyobacter kobayashii]
MVSLAGTGALYQALATIIDRQHFPPVGQMVNVGGYKLHLDCTGTGSPTVILEAGLADTTLVWSKVQPAVSTFTRVCSYDRAGDGGSEVGQTPRTGKQIVTELHTLLAKAHIAGPYILVGHSLGGLYVRLYASTYPQQVVGMVLVDPSYENQPLPAAQDIQDHYFDRWLALFGIPRLVLQLNLEHSSTLNEYAPAVLPALKAYQAQPQFFRTYADELAAFGETAHEVRTSAQSLGSLPLVVLFHALPTPPGVSWQAALAQLSSRSKLVIASQSGHYIQLEQPNLVIAAIQQVFREIAPV